MQLYIFKLIYIIYIQYRKYMCQLVGDKYSMGKGKLLVFKKNVEIVYLFIHNIFNIYN